MEPSIPYHVPPCSLVSALLFAGASFGFHDSKSEWKVHKTYKGNEEKSKPDDLDISNIMGCSDVTGQVFSTAPLRGNGSSGFRTPDGIKVRLLNWEKSHDWAKGVKNTTLMRLNVSDLIWGTDAAHTLAGWGPSPSPWKSYRSTGPAVGGGGGCTPQSFRWAQFGLVAARQKSHIFVSWSKVQYLEGIVLFC